ncbi:hypothetical protein [Telluribacter sp.]|jgi:hypothetical protein|uniref:hypothetical protein n=1 Tax=Telluribacter sp. TaxID=1978767 RepID=UPI002E0F8AD8|nr:hypothetical protein [Telluribacter sp.]
MKNEILDNLDKPQELEKLYRGNKPGFRQEFNNLYPQLSESTTAHFWNARLNFQEKEINWGAGRDLLFVILAVLLAGTLARVPLFSPVSEDFFYPRNIGFIVFPWLAVYFARKNSLSVRKMVVVGGLFLVAVLYINLLPDNPKSDTLVLACLHLLLFLWSVLAVSFVGGQFSASDNRLNFLRYNGDLIVVCALLGIAGVLMSGITIGLFSLINLKIEEFYFQNIAIYGLAALPIVGTYLTQTNPQLVNRISPLIARLFSPLVLVMLLVYLTAILYTGKDPYNDREFLLIFNALLVGVMALIFFSVAEGARASRNRAEIVVLFLLSMITIIVNGIALSAILFRITEWGLTPNRAAVLGGNILILINLLLIAGTLVRVLTRNASLSDVGKAITAYLPVYWVWAALVTFLFPLLFGFR